MNPTLRRLLASALAFGGWSAVDAALPPESLPDGILATRLMGHPILPAVVLGVVVVLIWLPELRRRLG